MKNAVYLLFVFIFFSCSTQKKNLRHENHNNGIVYVFPEEVIRRLSLLDLKTESNIYFSLEKIRDFEFRIYFDKYIDNDNWVINTNRYVSISNKLYPLTFDLDMYFANSETAEEFLKSQEDGIYKRTQRTIIRDNVYHIDFTFEGKILYDGYGW